MAQRIVKVGKAALSHYEDVEDCLEDLKKHGEISISTGDGLYHLQGSAGWSFTQDEIKDRAEEYHLITLCQADTADIKGAVRRLHNDGKFEVIMFRDLKAFMLGAMLLDTRSKVLGPL